MLFKGGRLRHGLLIGRKLVLGRRWIFGVAGSPVTPKILLPPGCCEFFGRSPFFRRSLLFRLILYGSGRRFLSLVFRRTRLSFLYFGLQFIQQRVFHKMLRQTLL